MLSNSVKISCFLTNVYLGVVLPTIVLLWLYSPTPRLCYSIMMGEYNHSRGISLGKRIEQTHVSNYNVRLYVKNIIEAVYRGVHGALYFNRIFNGILEAFGGKS
jgi:hypothetical protein